MTKEKLNHGAVTRQQSMLASSLPSWTTEVLHESQQWVMTVCDLTEAVPHVRLMQQLTDAIDGLVDVADSHVPRRQLVCTDKPASS